jgi:integrase
MRGASGGSVPVRNPGETGVTLRGLLIDKTIVLTGLRLGELASITAGQLHLDDPQRHAELLARDAKAGRAARIPLRQDLAHALEGGRVAQPVAHATVPQS